MTPRVSVLMTIYNAGPYLEPALDSLLQQTFPDFELVAVENGSTDGSVERLRACDDARIRRIELPANIGRTPALNLALNNARGDYVAVLDADDLAEPERLARQVAFLDTRPDVVLVGTWCRFLYDTGVLSDAFEPPVAHDELVDMMASQNPFVHSSVMYRRASAVEAGGYPEDFAYAQDYALFLRLLERGRLGMLSDVLAVSRVHAASVTQRPESRVTIAYDELRLFRRSSRLAGQSARARRQGRMAVADHAVRYGHALADLGHRAEAVRWLLYALVRDPFRCLENPAFVQACGAVCKAVPASA